MYEQKYLRVVKLLAGFGLTTIVAIKTIPHLYPALWLKRTGGLSQNNESLDDIYKNILVEVCKDMAVDYRKIHLVNSEQLSSISGGSFYFPTKSYIGLPQGCDITDLNKIKASNFMFDGKTVDLNSYTGKQLLDSLLLTDQQVKFLIAHELTHIKEHHFIFFLVNSVAIFSIFFKAGLYMPTLIEGKRSLLSTAFLNLITWSTGYVIYKGIQRFLIHSVEFRADKVAAQLGQDYCDGGITTLRKSMKLNRIVRLMNHKENLISEIGNNVQDYMSPTLSQRLKELKTIKKDMY